MTEEKKSDKGKLPHVSGEYGVDLSALAELRVKVWMHELLQRAGRPPGRYGELSLEEVRALLAQYPALARGKQTQIPEGAEFALYLLGQREPTEKMVEAIAQSVPVKAPGTQPFADTDEIYLKGPGGFDLWRVLEPDLDACREVVTGELKIASVANAELAQLLGKAGVGSAFRWGVAHRRGVSVFRQLLLGIDERDRYEVPDLREFAVSGEPHPVALAFAVAMENPAKGVIDEWQSYFVTAIALWQLSEDMHDSRNESDFILAGMLALPVVVSLFPGYGVEIRDYVVGMVKGRIGTTIKSRANRWAAYFDIPAI